MSALEKSAAFSPPRPLVPEVGPVPRFFAGLLVGFLAWLSPRGLRRCARFVGGLAWTLGIRRAVTLDNLRQALPELSEPERQRIARGAYDNMALAALESICATARKPRDPTSDLKVDNWELLEGLVAEGKGVLLATAHFGNWELLGELLCRRGLPLHAVVRPLKGALNERIVRSRIAAGMQLIHPRGAYRSTLKALARGGVVAMLVDQVIAEKHGVFVPFFGRPACTNPALSIAARRTGAPVVVAMARREGDGLRLTLEGPFPVPDTGAPDEDVRAHTAQITAVIERHIRQWPEQWMWLHRRWKVQPVTSTAEAPAPARSSAPGS
ncbi:MAG: lysophospholipid acyltransferase family protein [Myxococcaceae bacterium]|nr:lysophospholipid acyltransferase family protein [Myxococcaceae bacterium]